MVEEYRYKIVLMGDADVGKTTICKIFRSGILGQNSQSTIGVAYHCKNLDINIEKDGKNKSAKLMCEMWDTAGSERYRSLITIYLRGAHLALLVFDVNNRESFLNLENWWRTIISYDNETNIVIIGNKTDLESKVSEEEINHFCKEKNMTYFQCSCYSSDIIQNLTNLIVQQFKSTIIKNPKLENKKNIILPEKTHQSKFCCFY